jgi:hypothetical protein
MDARHQEIGNCARFSKMHYAASVVFPCMISVGSEKGMIYVSKDIDRWSVIGCNDQDTV